MSNYLAVRISECHINGKPCVENTGTVGQQSIVIQSSLAMTFDVDVFSNGGKAVNLGPRAITLEVHPRQNPINDAANLVRSGSTSLQADGTVLELESARACAIACRGELGSQNEPLTVSPGALPNGPVTGLPPICNVKSELY